VAVGGLSQRQSDLYRPTDLDGRIKEAARTGGFHAICVTGSAGGGKSGLIEKLRQDSGDLFSGIIEDATHADLPSTDQAGSIAAKLASLSDGNDGQRPALPVLIAANTGMLLNLFDEFRRKHEAGRGPAFTELESLVLFKLGITSSLPVTGLSLLLVNLDERPTSGEGGLLSQFLSAYEPELSGGILADASACSACDVQDWCPVYANAVMMSGCALATIDGLATSAAAEQGRWDTPRALWDFTSRIAAPGTYGEDQTSGDPCDQVRSAANNKDRAWVVKRLLPWSLFGTGGSLGTRVGKFDPARHPSASAYKLLSEAGLMPEADLQVLQRLREVAPGAGALDRISELVNENPDQDGFPSEFAQDFEGGWRGFLGHFLVTAALITGDGSADDAYATLRGEQDGFTQLLRGYEAVVEGSEDPAGSEGPLSKLDLVIERGLAAMLGRPASAAAYFPVKAYDPRDPSRIFVQVDVQGSMEPVAAVTVRNNPDGASIVGYRPLAVTAALSSGDESVEITIDAPAYQMLLAAERGLLASTADTARFYALRRAADLLARTAASPDAQLLIDDPLSSASYTVRRAPSFGSTGGIRKLQVRRA
jgi:hypothetical protein